MPTKTIRFRRSYKPDQEAKFILEVEVKDANGAARWSRLESFADRSRAEGYVDGYKAGLKHLDTMTDQTSVPNMQDEWPKT